MVFARQSYPQLKKSLSGLGFNPLDVGAGNIPSPTTGPTGTTGPTTPTEQPVQPVQPEGESRTPEVPTDDENRRRVEFSVGDLDFKDFNPFDIFSSEDLIRSAKISNSPVAKFGPTVLGLLGGPVVGGIARLASFLTNREVEKVLDLRDINNEGLKDQWRKGNTEERQSIISKIEKSSKQAREATKPVEISVDPTVDRPAGVQQPTTITPQEAAAAAVTGSQNLSFNVIPDVPDFDVGDVEGAAAAGEAFGISFNKDGGEIRQPLVIGGVASQVGKGASKLLTRLQRETPKKLVAKDPTSVRREMSELMPETTAEDFSPTQIDDLFTPQEPITLTPETINVGTPVIVDESIPADTAIGITAKNIFANQETYKKQAKKEFADLNIEPYKDDPNPDMQKSIKEVLNKEKTVGEHKQFVEETKPITKWDIIPYITKAGEIPKFLRAGKLFTKEGKLREKTGVYGLNKNISEGTILEARLDIHSYLDANKWIAVLFNKETKETTYSPTGYLTDVTFKHGENQAKKVGTGEKTKSPFGTIKGKWKNHNSETLSVSAKKLLDNPEWVQVGYDPRRHSIFYTREAFQGKPKGTPLESALEMIQIGPLVLVKNPKFLLKQIYKKGGKVQDMRDGGRISYSSSRIGSSAPAALIDGHEFFKVAEKFGLATDNQTLNKIVNLVNQGYGLETAASIVATKSKIS